MFPPGKYSDCQHAEELLDQRKLDRPSNSDQNRTSIFMKVVAFSFLSLVLHLYAGTLVKADQKSDVV